MEHFEKALTSNTVYEGKVVTLKVDTVELENGSTALREVVLHNGGVSILALDDADNLLMVRQYRYPHGKVLLELPAGKLEKGENPRDCGIRELEEETGYIAVNFQPFGQLVPTPGFVSEILYMFVAKDLTAAKQHLDEDEFLTVERIPFKKALEMCLTGEIEDGKTLVSILKYAAINGITATYDK